MLDELQNALQNTTPETWAVLQTIGTVVGAFLAGQILSTMVTRGLRARNFDAALRPPGAPPADESDNGITPTLIAGWLVRLTVWLAPVWWLARERGKVELAGTLGLIVSRTWVLAVMLAVTLALGSLLARRLIACLQGPGKGEHEPWAARNGAAAPRWSGAGLAGAVVYGLVVLLALLVAADMFDWPLTRSSAQALWQLAQQFLTVGAAVFIGGLGARWAREQVTAEAASPQQRAGQYTAVGIVGVTTLLAVTVLLSTAGLLVGLAALGVVGLLLWLVRRYIPDVVAGFQLRSREPRELWLDEAVWYVSEVGLLATHLTRAGEFRHLPNRVVLDALSQPAPTADSPA